MRTKITKATVRRWSLDMAFYLLGCVLYAAAINCFTVPNQLVPGGVTGVATLLNFLFHIPVGIAIVLMNLPLFVASWRKLGREFTLRTMLVTTLSSAIIDLTAPFLPVFTGDMVLTALFGGVLSGAGLGLIYMRGATTGGSEIAARLLERKLHHIPIGRLILLVDAVVVIIAAIVYRNVESALYAMVLIYVSTSVMDGLIYGSEKGKMLLIMTKQEQAVTQKILEVMARGVTKLNATGAYTGDQQQVLLCAVRRSEVYQLRLLVQESDPNAFIIVVSTDEVLGEGFKKKD